MIGTTNSGVLILNQFKITICPKDFDPLIGTTDNREKIIKMAEELLLEVQGIWRPRAIIRWLKVECVTKNGVILTSFDNRNRGFLQLGSASKFMTNARQGLVGVYTAGDELEKLAAKASQEKRYMDAFLYDQIGLVLLEKTKRQIERIVEEEGRSNNWGVGPFLSPGSIHGWGLGDQANLCALVPLNKIDVELKGGEVFSPFVSISCLIGIGPKYDAKTVGSTCDVCSKSHNCEIQRSRQIE